MRLLQTSLLAKRGVTSRRILTKMLKTYQGYDVRTRSPFVAAGKLSGGNQQKVIVARELKIVQSTGDRVSTHAPAWTLARSIYPQRDHRMRDRGVAVLLISAGCAILRFQTGSL